MSHPPIGIDLGTTYSAVATLDEQGIPRLLPNAEGKYLTPSVILFEEGGNIVVGEIAKKARVDEPDRVVEFIKRSMGTKRRFHYTDQDFDATTLSGIILDKLKLDAEKALNGQPIHKAVITVPAYFGAERRDATEKAANIAGIEVMALISEPTAAALAFGMGGDKTGTALVFDLGGGTFDVTVIRFGADNVIEVLAVDGNHELGGRDFDDQIIDIVAQQFQREHDYDLRQDVEALAELRQKAEEAKHELSARESTTISISAEGRKLKMPLSREEFSEAMRPHLEGMKLTLQVALDEAELTPADILDVLMVGGSSRIPAVREMVANFFHKEPNTSIHPDEAVALGACLFAVQRLAADQGEIPTPQVRERAKGLPSVMDIAPHSIGVTALDKDNLNQEYNSIILPRGTQLPTTMQNTYYTTHNGQQIIKVDVNEGEDEELVYVRQLGNFTLRLPEPRPADSPIVVNVSLDLSSIIRVVATDVKSGQSQEIVINYNSNMSQEQVQERATWLKRQKVQ